MGAHDAYMRHWLVKGLVELTCQTQQRVKYVHVYQASVTWVLIHVWAVQQHKKKTLSLAGLRPKHNPIGGIVWQQQRHPNRL